MVVVAGVGDNPRSDAAERVANGLTLWADFDPPEEHSEWFKVSDRIQPVQRFVTRSPGGTCVDLYEFWTSPTTSPPFSESRLVTRSWATESAPRCRAKRMLERYRALMAYVGRRSYEKVVFVAHSQGTILTTTLLAEEDVPLPGQVSTPACRGRAAQHSAAASQRGSATARREAECLDLRA